MLDHIYEVLLDGGERWCWLVRPCQLASTESYYILPRDWPLLAHWWGPAQIEAVEVFPAAGVAVRRGEEHRDYAALRDVDPCDRHVGRGDAEEDLHCLVECDARRRSLEMFSGGYLMFFAIIQGVGLVVLVERATTVLTTDANTGWIRVTVFGEISANFLALAVVTYLYLRFTALLAWPLTFIDTLIPIVSARPRPRVPN
jgi:hypothetical protein